jgi:hypothetical protein
MSSKLSDLNPIPSALVDADLIYVVKGGASYKGIAGDLKAYIGVTDYTAGTGINISDSNVVSFKSLKISQFINDSEFIRKVTTGAVRVALSNKDLDLKSGNFTANSARFKNLAGAGSQMVVTNNNGDLSSQAMPTGLTFANIYALTTLGL